MTSADDDDRGVAEFFMQAGRETSWVRRIGSGIVAFGILGLAGSAAIALVTYVMWGRYGRLFAAPFDEYSRVYLAQLSSLNPEAAKHAWALSIINESWLFFQYGLRWLLPSGVAGPVVRESVRRACDFADPGPWNFSSAACARWCWPSRASSP